MGTPPHAATCTSSSDHGSYLDKNVAAAGVSTTITCTGGGSWSPRAHWTAYCSPFGSWHPDNKVNMIRGEAVAAGAPSNVGDATQPVIAPGPAVKSYRWSIQCLGEGGAFTEYSTTLPDGAAPVDPVVLRNAAIAQLAIPDPELGGSPPLDNPDRFSIVHVPTWLWITHAWQPLSASSSDGGVSVTVTATPTEVRWNPGDGESEFPCPDPPGEPWRRGLDDSEGCTHTYVRSSVGQPNDAYELTATVTWSLTWSVNGTDLGEFDVYQPTLTIDHQVGEIHAVNTSS